MCKGLGCYITVLLLMRCFRSAQFRFFNMFLASNESGPPWHKEEKEHGLLYIGVSPIWILAPLGSHVLLAEGRCFFRERERERERESSGFRSTLRVK